MELICRNPYAILLVLIYAELKTQILFPTGNVEYIVAELLIYSLLY